MLNGVQDPLTCSTIKVTLTKKEVGGWRDRKGIPGLDHSSKRPR